ncbi:probable helicase MAGATAMA 3 [Triticum aestivum]|nr:probable helicase MAGATAMA 3 [Triticum aestivum]XP_044385846.1 probable helicase MAGATAMA 3 [Triticum aestivum]
MNVDENLAKIFLDRRVYRLVNVATSWRHYVNHMLELLAKPLCMHSLYLKDVRSERRGDILRLQGVGDAELERRRKVTFNEFFIDNYECHEEALRHCFETLHNDLPLSARRFDYLDETLRSLEAFGKLLRSEPERPLGKLFFKNGGWPEFQEARALCLNKLEHLPDWFDLLPSDSSKIEDYVLNNATIILCTAASSFNLRRVRDFQPFELLVIDEAAQLKECESLIPLQLGIHRAVLIGDECQLPALVKSKLSAEAGFGRSLFERLCLLGHPKHLLDVQYRMHPEISKFPISSFYCRKVTDGPNVLHRDYERKLLDGPMYGPYSFINIQGGIESSGMHGTSLSNAAEVAAVTRIVQRLSQVDIRSKLSVGVVSPYKAQVRAIQESLALEHDKYGGLSVKIRTVDGFQGAEEDVVIFSAVRANTHGSVGFLSDQRRTNVAQTRAKHCFWILGDAATLSSSRTIWQKIVADAKERGCFYDGNDDKDLCSVVSVAIKKDEVNRLLKMVDARLGICSS